MIIASTHVDGPTVGLRDKRTEDLKRRMELALDAPFYARKANYSGMDVSKARKLEVLKDENARLAD